jgi:putative ABC transport system ATP-binding protein
VVFPQHAQGLLRIHQGTGAAMLRAMSHTDESPPRSAPAVAVSALEKVYGSGAAATTALDRVDLSLSDGEFVAIMGPSGSGKSTLLHIVGALESPSGGHVEVAGRRLDGMSEHELTLLRRDHIGFVFQFFNLLPSLSAIENVLLPALIARRLDGRTRDRAQALLERVGLGERAGHLPSELSGGEQQRVSIARAMLMSPELLLADEPTGNLDSRAGGQVLRLLRELNRDEGRTVVMVTHDPSAAAVADRIVFLRDGRVAGELPGGDTHSVIEFFATLETPLESELSIVGGTAVELGPE